MIPRATAYEIDVQVLRARVCYWQRQAETLGEELTRMRHRIECLRGALKSASGKFFEIGECGAGEDCLEWAGDMEPPLMGPNV